MTRSNSSSVMSSSGLRTLIDGVTTSASSAPRLCAAASMLALSRMSIFIAVALPPPFLIRRDRLLGEREVDVGDDDLGAVSGEAERARLADAARAADHQRAAAGKVEQLGIVEHRVSSQF